MTIELNQIINGDCLEVMKEIESKSIDMILCDLPYGTTACKWDVVIPFEPLWEQYKRIIKDNGAIVLTASQPFTTDLINSNREWFKYEIIWNKTFGKDVFATNKRPQKAHENILLFYSSQPTYNPQKTKGKSYTDIRKKKIQPGTQYQKTNVPIINKGFRNPISVIEVINANFEGMHPTQKPVALFKYLIKTYTNENETVLDNCSGSGTTAVACIDLNRNYICIEKDKDYYEQSIERVEKENIKLKLAI